MRRTTDREVHVTIEFSEDEVRLLLERLEADRTEMFHALHHTATSAYRARLRREITLLEGVLGRLAAEGAEARTTA